MENLIKINNVAIGIKEYNGKRVVTFKDIDHVHERPDNTARKAFNRNKKRFIKGEDYFVHHKDEAKRLFGIVAPNGVTTLTELGYLMISKVFDDDLAWEVQRKLVTSYFTVIENQDIYSQSIAFKAIADILTTIQQDINTLKEAQQKKNLPEKKYLCWKTNTFTKLNTLISYVNEHTQTKLYNYQRSFTW